MTVIKLADTFPRNNWSSAAVQAFFLTHGIKALQTVSDVNNSDLEGAAWVFVSANHSFYAYDATATNADDGDSWLLDNQGRRYRKIAGSGAASWDVQVADLTARGAYDDEAEGFSVLVSDADGNGRAAIYTKASATSADWAGPAWFTGTNGADGADGEPDIRDLRRSYVEVDFMRRRETVLDAGNPVNTKTGAIGAIGTFARASTGFQVDEAGYYDDVAINEPRWRHDPETRAMKGVMFGPANDATSSLDQNIANWVKTNVTVTASALPGADGGTSAFEVLETSATGAHMVSKAKSLTAGQRQAFAFTCAPDGRDAARIYIKAAAGALFYADIAVDARGVASSSGMTVMFKELQDGLVRVNASFVPDVTGTYTVGIQLRDDQSVSYAGNTGKGLALQHPTFGPGYFAPEPWPDATQAIDTWSMAATKFATSATGGTLIIEADACPDGTTSGHYATILFAAGTHQAIIRNGTAGENRIVATLNAGPGVSASIVSAAGANSGRMVMAMIWDEDKLALWINGVCQGETAHNGAPTSLTDWRVGWTGTSSWGAAIGRARYVPYPMAPQEIFSWRDHPPAVSVGVSGSAPDRIVTLNTDHGPLPLTSGGDDHAPWIDIDAGMIRWTHTGSDGVETQMRLPLSIAHTLDLATQARWEFSEAKGQSREAGVNGLPLADTAIASARRALMPAKGVKLAGGLPGQETVLVQPAAMTPLKNLREVTFGSAGQTIAASFVRRRLASMGASVAAFHVNSAIGSTAIAKHIPGTPPHSNGGFALGIFSVISHFCGIRPEGSFLAFNQGDGDSTALNDTSYADWLARLLSIHDARTSAWTMIQDWAEKRFGTRPRDHWTLLCQFAKAGTDFDVAEAMMAASLDGTRKIRIAAPDYIFKTSYQRYLEDPSTGLNLPSDDHHGARDMLFKGAYYERMAAQIAAGNTAANILHPVTVTRVGAVVTVNWNTTAPNLTMPLQLRNDLVPNHSDGNYGFSYWVGGKKGAGGVKQTISVPPAVNGSNQVAFTLASVPGGGEEWLGIGVDPEAPGDKIGPQAGAPRCNLCDSTTATATEDGETMTLRNYSAIGWWQKS